MLRLSPVIIAKLVLLQISLSKFLLPLCYPCSDCPVVTTKVCTVDVAGTEVKGSVKSLRH